VTSVKIANGAVTPGKIAFYGNVRIVAPTGGDFSDPYVAMSTHSSWCPNPSANPCLLKIMPGVYNIGTSSVQMQSYIDIEGSGENTTIIQGSIDNPVSGIVNGASNSEIGFLTVKNTGGGTNAIAIYNSGASTKITNVTVTATGAVHNNYAVVNQNSSSPSLLNVAVTASGGIISIGVHNVDSSATMFNVTAIGSGGANNIGVANNSTSGLYAVTIQNSVISGSSYTVSNSDNATITTHVGSTQLISGHSPSTYGSVTCAGVYNVNYTFSANTCL
jgi:hypothetical protein